MTEEIRILIYLAACVVNQTAPEASRISAADGRELMLTAWRHYLSAVTAWGLKTAGRENEDSMLKLYTAISTDKLFDTERRAVLGRMEEERIRHMPLKGVIIKNLYPMPCLREMSDNDILIDADRAEDVREIMTARGYETEKFESGHRDDYRKPPVYHFEMHRVLFDEETPHEGFYDYFAETGRRMIRDPDHPYRYHLSDEDFYIYMIAHEYKHYEWAGTGLRSLLDVYVYLNKHSEELNWPYISAEMDKLGISVFEKENRDLAMKVFAAGDTERLTGEERTRLDYYIRSGAYGTRENAILNRIHRVGKIRYIAERAFLPMKVIKEKFPFFYKYRILIPFLPVYRVIRGFRNAVREVRMVLKK